MNHATCQCLSSLVPIRRYASDFVADPVGAHARRNLRVVVDQLLPADAYCHQLSRVSVAHLPCARDFRFRALTPLDRMLNYQLFLFPGSGQPIVYCRNSLTFVGCCNVLRFVKVLESNSVVKRIASNLVVKVVVSNLVERQVWR